MDRWKAPKSSENGGATMHYYHLKIAPDDERVELDYVGVELVNVGIKG